MNIKPKPLNLKSKLDRQAFIREYHKNNADGRKAMKVLSPEITDDSLKNKLCRWGNSPLLAKELVAYFDSQDLTREQLGKLGLANIVKVITKFDTKDSDSIQASNTLLKFAGLLTGETHQSVNIVGKDALHDMIRSYRKDNIDTLNDKERS